MESEDMQEYVLDLGKTVESLVGEYLIQKYHEEIVDAFPDTPEIDIWRLDDDDTWTIEPSFAERIQQNIVHTKKAILSKAPIIYQPWFEWEDCYVRADYMILNPEWSYDLIEVKAKSSVRKEVTDDEVKKKIWKIDDEFLHDVAFQKYIINTVFSEWWEQSLWEISIAHVNPLYIRHGNIDIGKICIMQKVWVINSISVIQRKKETIVHVDDSLETGWNIQAYIELMRAELPLSEEEFWKYHQFPGNKYLEYFGMEKPFGTIYSIPYSRSTSAVVKDWHEQGIRWLEELSPEELSRIEKSGARFLDFYFRSAKWALVENTMIAEELEALRYPICFYDYESISTPVPLLDSISPYQQAVVQYSLHKIYEDGHIDHYGGVLLGQWDYEVHQVVDMEDPDLDMQINRVVIGTQEEFLRLFLSDIGKNIDTSSFVVWYKDFENTRNKEMWEKYPIFTSSFEKINENTYDLYEIFKQYKYFDRDFKGSASIKKVLPVLVPELSYDHLPIGKGDIAMNKLAELIWNKVQDKDERTQIARDLLIYCRQDSWAMVRIFRFLLSL